jgi:hypothetical protein
MRLVALTLLLGAACALQGQIRPPEMTGGVANCRWWETASSDMRMDFILGYYGGAASSKEVMEAIQTAASPEEIVRGVGAYCGAPLNGSIPLPMIVMIWVRVSRGASNADTQAALEWARRGAAKREERGNK